jgi:predicted phage terminase large subunit-like protein
MMNKAQLLKTRETDDFYFTSLYQQLPYERAGQRYKRDWFKTVSQLPEKVTLKYAVRFWDKSNSTKGDYTAGVLIGFGTDGYFYILDLQRKRVTSYERDQLMLKTAEGDREVWGDVKVWHQQDPGSAGKDSAEATNRTLMQYAPKFETVTGDKETRSESLESGLQGGMVFLMQGAWNMDFIDECVAFPRGRYDDQVDAASSAYNKLLELIARGKVGKARSWEG